MPMTHVSTEMEGPAGGPPEYAYRLGARSGLARRWIAGRTGHLAEAIAGDAFAGMTFVGALPFDRAEAGFLLVPEANGSAPVGEACARNLVPPGTVRPVPAPQAYGAQVDLLSRRIEAGQAGLAKAVLARTLEIEAREAIDPFDLFSRLDGDATLRFCLPLPEPGGDFACPPRWLLGATPELLLSKRGGAIASNPLAGSARRHPDPGEDRAAADRLVTSGKDLHEHALVVEYILDVLSPHCRRLSAPRAPSVEATRSMWHLGTRIEGTLKTADTPCLDLVAMLHPTPAVAGVPLGPALDAIAEIETIGRGFYAGAVGWTDRTGDGDWHVTLRCTEIDGARARLFAGAGIVSDSTPQGEVEETRAKFTAMLSAFGYGDGPTGY